MTDFYDWYGSQIGFDEMAIQFGFANFDQMADWLARRLGFDSYEDLARQNEDDDDVS